MKQRRLLLPALASLIAACTYNEYKTYNQIVDPEDAGVPVARAGSGPIAAAGQSGSGGSAGQAGSAGAAGAGGAAGASADTVSDCTGCLRLTASPDATRNIRLEFADAENLSATRVTWRMRVLGFTGNVYLAFYAQSGDSVDDFITLTNLTLDSTAGWQEVGSDLTALPAFAPAVFIDGGGVGGNGFDPGFPFDKSKVERFGVSIYASAQSGVFTPFNIEIDSVAFSNHPELSATFASTDGGFQLVETESEFIAGATLEQVDD